MNCPVIAFLGLSGVGKTTFLRHLRNHVSFQHLTGGSLIAAAREVSDGDRDQLRHADLDENQRLLIRGFELQRDPEAPFLILDGHAVIDNGHALTKLPVAVFREIGTAIVVHLEADPGHIAAYRTSDKDRDRPHHNLETLAQHQSISRAHAGHIAQSLSIDMHIVGHGDAENLAARLETGLRSGQTQ